MHVCACNVCSRRCGNVRRTRMAGMAVMTKTQAAMPSRKQPPPMSRPARLAAAACARAAGRSQSNVAACGRDASAADAAAVKGLSQLARVDSAGWSVLSYVSYEYCRTSCAADGPLQL